MINNAWNNNNNVQQYKRQTTKSFFSLVHGFSLWAFIFSLSSWYRDFLRYAKPLTTGLLSRTAQVKYWKTELTKY